MRLLGFLAWRSLWSRKLSSFLAVVSMALSCALVLGVERLAKGLQTSFSQTISKTDLIVGARGGSVELLLYTVFHMGQASNNIRMESYREFAEHPAVAWTIPISLGDSYRGHRVVATDHNFFEHYRFRGERKIEFSSGGVFKEALQVVLGSDVALKQGLKENDFIVLSHGIGDSRVSRTFDHDEHPFQVIGVLKKTGTPVDKSLYISLEGMEAVHGSVEAPTQLTAFMLGSQSRIGVLHLQREISTYTPEALTAIIPGVTLSELWRQLSYLEEVLKVISAVVLGIAFIGIMLSLFASLNERRRELALLRVVGARPIHILSLLMTESVFLTALGSFLGIVGAFTFQALWAPWIESEFSVTLPLQLLTATEMKVWLALVVLAPLVGFLPAWRAYRQSLAYDLIQK